MEKKFRKAILEAVELSLEKAREGGFDEQSQKLGLPDSEEFAADLKSLAEIGFHLSEISEFLDAMAGRHSASGSETGLRRHLFLMSNFLIMISEGCLGRSKVLLLLEYLESMAEGFLFSGWEEEQHREALMRLRSDEPQTRAEIFMPLVELAIRLLQDQGFRKRSIEKLEAERR